jgi:hypothetical protein
MALLYAAGLFALDALLVVGGVVLAFAFVALAARASGLDGARLVLPCVIGCGLALAGSVSGCGCRRVDRAYDAAFHALRGPTEDEQRPALLPPAQPAAMPLHTPWPPMTR